MSPLLPIFQRKLIPWAQEGLAQRLIVARSVLKKSSLPSDVELTRMKISGKRVIVRNRRIYGNQRVYYALWPEAELHELDVPKLICVLNGGITDFQVGKYGITCNEGHFILVPSRTPMPLSFAEHFSPKLVDNGEEEGVLLGINLYRDSLHCIIHTRRRREKINEHDMNFLIRHPQAVQTFKLFTEEILSDETADITISGHLLSAFFLSMSREIAAGHQLNPGFQSRESTSGPSSVQEIRDYIKAHLYEGLTIEKVAREMYMSPSKFTQYLRQESGKTFVEILTECRVSEAKFLLKETRWSIAIISNQLGFKSSTYFGAFFLRHMGVSPGVYRLESQNAKV